MRVRWRRRCLIAGWSAAVLLAAGIATWCAAPANALSAPGTTQPPSRATTTTTTLPPRPTTTTTTTTVPSTTTTKAATTTTSTTQPPTTTTTSTTSTTTPAPPTSAELPPAPPEEPTEPPTTCSIITWWGNGAANPNVDPAYQNPSSDDGHLNVFGTGFVPGEWLDLLIDGIPIPVAGDGPPMVDEQGQFLANAPNTGGQMGWVESQPLPFTLTVEGDECSASAAIGVAEPQMQEAVESEFPILLVTLGILGGLLLIGGGLAAIRWRRANRSG